MAQSSARIDEFFAPIKQKNEIGGKASAIILNTYLMINVTSIDFPLAKINHMIHLDINRVGQRSS